MRPAMAILMLRSRLKLGGELLRRNRIERSAQLGNRCGRVVMVRISRLGVAQPGLLAQRSDLPQLLPALVVKSFLKLRFVHVFSSFRQTDVLVFRISSGLQPAVKKATKSEGFSPGLAAKIGAQTMDTTSAVAKDLIGQALTPPANRRKRRKGALAPETQSRRFSISARRGVMVERWQMNLARRAAFSKTT